MRIVRLIGWYAVCAVVTAAFSLLRMLPRYPTTPTEWLVLLLLPMPMAALGDYLFRYREFKLLKPIDALGERIRRSPYRVAIVAGIVAALGCVMFAVMSLILALQHLAMA